MKIIKLQPISIGLISLILTILSVLCGSFAAAAQNESYADWKAKQQQYDARLKQQQNQPSQNHSNHYLAKPELTAVSSADRIRLNSATVEQLQQLHGIGQKKAEAIIEYRNTHGKFKRVEDIQLVKGIGPALFAKNQARLAL
ncbi:ComEA family DNA-binding protein [Acinetobacter schindleri]|uniref:ComEA family DNA-binding protein n=1 Tax=Acinetobacter schindleri TaxID=108981 RepID=UPI000972C1C4|nr:ComEA family DNA-binding protein [Acinetobacter schindleri]APX61970.1 ComEA family DNA uptake protein/related DNA-binding protein [Acinetobacter schindleri]